MRLKLKIKNMSLRLSTLPLHQVYKDNNRTRKSNRSTTNSLGEDQNSEQSNTQLMCYRNEMVLDQSDVDMRNQQSLSNMSPESLRRYLILNDVTPTLTSVQERKEVHYSISGDVVDIGSEPNKTVCLLKHVSSISGQREAIAFQSSVEGKLFGDEPYPPINKNCMHELERKEGGTSFESVHTQRITHEKFIDNLSRKGNLFDSNRLVFRTFEDWSSYPLNHQHKESIIIGGATNVVFVGDRVNFGMDGPRHSARTVGGHPLFSERKSGSLQMDGTQQWPIEHDDSKNNIVQSGKYDDIGANVQENKNSKTSLVSNLSKSSKELISVKRADNDNGKIVVEKFSETVKVRVSSSGNTEHKLSNCDVTGTIVKKSCGSFEYNET